MTEAVQIPEKEKKELLKNIKECKNTLKEITENTETEFINLGTDLEKFYSASEEISCLAEKSAELFAGEKISSIIEKINVFLEKLETLFKNLNIEAENMYSGFESISSGFAKVQEVLPYFGKDIKNLNSLQILTRIAVARLQHKESDFISLADDISGLTEKIKEKKDNISKGITNLNSIVKNTVKEIENLYKGENRKADSIISSISENFEIMKEDYSENKTRADQIHSKFTEISSSIGSIVSSLQFHDITRQRTEHVLEALEKIESIIENDIYEKYSEASVISNIQTAQLQDAGNSLYNAGEDIVINLQNIIENTEEVSGIIKGMTEQDGKKEKSVIYEVEENLEFLFKAVDETHEYSDKLLEHMSKIKESIDSISVWMYDINDIGYDIQLLALNARIRAAQLGLEGRELGVIAEEIQNLSHSVHENITELTENLEEIVKSSEQAGKEFKLVDDSNREKSSENEKTSKMLHSLENSIKTLKSENSDTAAVIESLKTKKNKLSEDISECISDFKIHSTIKEKMEKISTETEKIHNKTEKYSQGSDLSFEELNNLKNKYTMESERETHNKLSGDADIDDFEEFTPDDDFGGNVELF